VLRPLRPQFSNRKGDVMRFLATVLVASGLLAVSCVTAPIAYQDGLPASMPPPGYAAARLGYNRMYWWHGYSEPEEKRDTSPISSLKRVKPIDPALLVLVV
jgi:hypothetical protein